MYRLFVAIDIPEHIKEFIADSIAYELPEARWVDMDQLHLTLRFIGDVDGAVLRDVRSILGQIKISPFELTLKSVGYFGSKKEPRILWTGVEAQEGLLKLQRKIDRAFIQNGFAPERRKFSPHVTIARLKNIPFSQVGQYMQEFGLFKSEKFVVNEFQLLSTVKSKYGPFYRLMDAYELEEVGRPPLVANV